MAVPPLELKDGDVGERREDVAVDFVTFGMFIIDDIDYLPPRPPVRDIVGGAGAFAALGARLFSPPPQASRTVGWVVDQGSDFPEAMTALIDSWQTAVVMRADAGRLTTRGWNGYDTGERRAFRYLTPKRRLTVEDLPGPLLAGRAFHIISSAARCRDLVTDLLAARKAAADAAGRPRPAKPVIVWEPVPDRCTPDELLECTHTLRLVDVCSPNHSELAAYMGDAEGGLDPATGQLSRAAVERACEQLLASMPLQSYALVVRAAEHGCYLATNGGRRRRRRRAVAQPKRAALLTMTEDELAVPSSASSPPSELVGAGPGTTTVAAAAAGTSILPLRPAPPHPRQPQANALHGSLRPDMDMFALLAGLQQDADGVVPLSRAGGDDDEAIEIDPGLEVWVPAVFGPDSGPDSTSDSRPQNGQDGSDTQTAAPKASPVVDPTGGGNAFMGGLAVALARGKSLEEAAAWGNVAASFAIEQVGVPVLGHDAAGRETWNGVRVEDRTAAYEARLRQRGVL